MKQQELVKLGKISFGDIEHIGQTLYISGLNFKIIREKLNPILTKDLSECLDNFLYGFMVKQEHTNVNNGYHWARVVTAKTYKVSFIYNRNIEFDFVLLFDPNNHLNPVCQLVVNDSIFTALEAVNEYKYFINA